MNVVLNTIIMDSILDQVIPIAHQAIQWNASVSYSAFCTLKSHTEDGMVDDARIQQLDEVVSELKSLKRVLKNIKNSDYYLAQVTRYFQKGIISNCQAGFKWVQVTPDGYIQQCSEMPRICHYSEYDHSKMKKVACAKCWYACRGESEAPHFNPQRIRELLSL